MGAEGLVRASRQTLSFVVPFHNEATCLPQLVQSLVAFVPAIESRYRLRVDAILVDDGSTDGSSDVLSAAIRAHEPTFDVRVIRLSRNFGKEAALTTGLDAATADAVIFMDADLQHPLALVEQFLEGWLAEGYDVVYAYKATNEDEGWLRRLARRVYYRTVNANREPDIPHNAGDFRLLTRRAYEALRLLPERARLMKGLYSWIGFPQKGIAFTPAERRGGRSKFSALRLAVLAVDGITSFSVLPLRLATFIGLAVAVISGGYGLWTIFEKLFFGIDAPGYATLITIIAFIGASQLIFLGIIGEYLGKVLIEVKGRPIAVVASDERIGAMRAVRVTLPGEQAADAHPADTPTESLARPIVER